MATGLTELIKANTAESCVAALEQYPDLLAPSASEDLAEIARGLVASADYATAEHVHAARALVRRVAQVGASRAVAERYRFQVRPTDDVRPRWEAFVERMRACNTGGDPDDLRQAIDLGHAMVTDPVVLEDDGMRIGLLRAYATALEASVEQGATTDSLDIALSARAEAIRSVPEGSVEEALLHIDFARAYVLHGQLSGDLEEIRTGAAMARSYVDVIPEGDLARPRP